MHPANSFNKNGYLCTPYSQLNKLNETIKDHKVHYQPRKRFVDKYLQEIGREDLITVEEEVELAQAIKRGDRRALEKLTRANLRFVVSVAKQYQNQGLSLPDLLMRVT